MNFAPVAKSYEAPRPRFESAIPVTPGASARYVGCDYIGNDSSSNSASSTGGLYAMAAFVAASFPRLSAIADVFLRYRFRRLRYFLIGKSASTQAGTGSWASFVIDATTTSITTNTEAIIKNAEGALVLKGWESGVHEVDVNAAGPKWYNCDGDSTPYNLGTFCHYLPQTTAAGDLSWDVYVEYDVEFAEAVAAATVTPLDRARKQKVQDRISAEARFGKKQVPDIEDLDLEILNLKQQLNCLECKKTSRCPS